MSPSSLQEKFEAQKRQGPPPDSARALRTGLGAEEGPPRAGESRIYQEEVEGDNTHVAAKLRASDFQQGCSDTPELFKVGMKHP